MATGADEGVAEDMRSALTQLARPDCHLVAQSKAGLTWSRARERVPACIRWAQKKVFTAYPRATVYPGPARAQLGLAEIYETEAQRADSVRSQQFARGQVSLAPGQHQPHPGGWLVSAGARPQATGHGLTTSHGVGHTPGGPPQSPARAVDAVTRRGQVPDRARRFP